MITLLFVSLTANCSKLLILWQQLQSSCPRSTWRFGGQSASWCQRTLSCSSVGNQLTIIGKVSLGMTGRGPIHVHRYLEHNALPDQWSWRSTGETWSDLLTPVTNLAAAFCKDCRRQNSGRTFIYAPEHWVRLLPSDDNRAALARAAPMRSFSVFQSFSTSCYPKSSPRCWVVAPSLITNEQYFHRYTHLFRLHIQLKEQIMNYNY